MLTAGRKRTAGLEYRSRRAALRRGRRPSRGELICFGAVGLLPHAAPCQVHGGRTWPRSPLAAGPPPLRTVYEREEAPPATCGLLSHQAPASAASRAGTGGPMGGAGPPPAQVPQAPACADARS